MSDEDFVGKRVLVTGGSKGPGRAVADQLRERGAEVWTTARSASGRELDDRFIAADISAATGSRAVADAVLAIGGIDLLVHTVGGSDAPGGGYRALTDAVWQEELGRNLLSAVRLDRELAPVIVERGGGAIVHVTSIQRRNPLPASTLAYAAAKAALATYSKGLAKELAPQGVRVNSVAPGWINTSGASALVERTAADQGVTQDAARALIMEGIGGIPLGRPSESSEVADLIVFLLSGRAASITGAEFVIDGGSTPTI